MVQSVKADLHKKKVVCYALLKVIFNFCKIIFASHMCYSIYTMFSSSNYFRLVEIQNYICLTSVFCFLLLITCQSDLFCDSCYSRCISIRALLLDVRDSLR